MIGQRIEAGDDVVEKFYAFEVVIEYPGPRSFGFVPCDGDAIHGVEVDHLPDAEFSVGNASLVTVGEVQPLHAFPFCKEFGQRNIESILVLLPLPAVPAFPELTVVAFE